MIRNKRTKSRVVTYTKPFKGSRVLFSFKRECSKASHKYSKINKRITRSASLMHSGSVAR